MAKSGLIFLLLVSFCFAGGNSVTIGDTASIYYTGLISETYIDEAAPTSNTSTTGFVRFKSQVDFNRKALFAIDLTSLAGVTVDSAKLYLVNTTNSAAASIYIASDTIAWVESQVTYNISATGTNWTGSVHGRETALDTVTHAGLTVGDTITIASAGFNSEVQDVVNGSGNPGYILNLILTCSNDVYQYFGSAEATINWHRPRFVVWYSAPSMYLSNTGNDSATGAVITEPWKTVAKVNATTLPAGSTVYFRTNDTWREQLTIPSSGTSGNPITFTKYDSTGESGADPIIDSTGVVVDFNGKDYIVLENIEVRNGLTQINLGTNNTIRYCEFDSADANALLLDGLTNSVYYNLFLNATTDAIEVDSSANTIYNNVIYSNGNGIDVDAAVTFQNNIVNTSGTNDINIAASVTVTGGYNIFEDAAKAGDGTYSGTSLWSTDPLWTTAGSDFTLQSTSPAIDAGANVGLVLDYAGNVVPYPFHPRGYDIGAYEYSIAAPSTGYEVRFPRFKDFTKFPRR